MEWLDPTTPDIYKEYYVTWDTNTTPNLNTKSSKSDRIIMTNCRYIPQCFQIIYPDAALTFHIKQTSCLMYWRFQHLTLGYLHLNREIINQIFSFYTISFRTHLDIVWEVSSEVYPFKQKFSVSLLPVYKILIHKSMSDGIHILKYMNVWSWLEMVNIPNLLISIPPRKLFVKHLTYPRLVLHKVSIIFHACTLRYLLDICQ